MPHQLVAEPDLRDDDPGVEERQDGREAEEKDERLEHAARGQDEGDGAEQGVPGSVDTDERRLRVSMYR